MTPYEAARLSPQELARIKTCFGMICYFFGECGMRRTEIKAELRRYFRKSTIEAAESYWFDRKSFGGIEL